MHAYAPDSPQAAARIVALMMIADGHVSQQELETLRECDVDYELGLATGEMHGILHTLCEDLVMGGTPGQPLIASVDNATLMLVLAEIGDPALQRKVYSLASAVAVADLEIHPGETRVLDAARGYWWHAWVRVPHLVHITSGARFRERTDPAGT